jgi:cystathionine beta-lyase/cystathionine gamma-synthase
LSSDHSRRLIERSLKTMPMRVRASNANALELATRLLAHPRVCSAIPGFRNAKQAACNVQAAADGPLAAADVAWLRDLFRA